MHLGRKREIIIEHRTQRRGERLRLLLIPNWRAGERNVSWRIIRVEDKQPSSLGTYIHFTIIVRKKQKQKSMPIPAMSKWSHPGVKKANSTRIHK